MSNTAFQLCSALSRRKTQQHALVLMRAGLFRLSQLDDLQNVFGPVTLRRQKIGLMYNALYLGTPEPGSIVTHGNFSI